MSSFNPECDDLNEWFFVSFTEMYEYYSSENECDDGCISCIQEYRAALSDTREFNNWCKEMIEIDITSDEYFIPAIINTIHSEDLIIRLKHWLETKTCDKCHLMMTDCCCEDEDEEEEEEEDEEEVDFKTTIVSGIICNECKNTLPDMTMQDHLDGKFNQECPHSETPPKSESDPISSTSVQDHLHHLGSLKAIWAKSQA